MHPVGQYIKITFPPEPGQAVIVEKEALCKAIVMEISPDIQPPFRKDSEIFIAAGRQVKFKGHLFIHLEHTFLYNA